MRSRSTAAVAAAAVLLGAIDTYVVVLALPAMMSDVGIGLDRLQQGAPIISGFLLGYVVLMLRNPVRAPHDFVAGTYLVPK